MTMMGDKDEKSQLQRRGGRRLSVPSSPISPSIPKRNDRAIRSPGGFHWPDPHSAVDAPSDRPFADLNSPSPNFDSSIFSSGSNWDGNRKTLGVSTGANEETQRSEVAEQRDGLHRPLLDGRPAEGKRIQTQQLSHSFETGSRNSPTMMGVRERVEPRKPQEGRDAYLEMPTSAVRNHSATSLWTERSISDENVGTKAAASTKKSRLNLLNPMSLLARRRSSHNTKLEDISLNVNTLQVPAIPDNFDPSIRGKYVIDFSKPRSRRTQFENSPIPGAVNSPANPRQPSDLGTPETQFNSPSPASHSPMFKEHLQEGNHTIQPGYSGYLQSIAGSRNAFDSPSLSSLPTFAQKLPLQLPDPQNSPETEQKAYIPHPDVPPPPPPKRTPSPHVETPPLAALPKHMTSVSSRFSFQIAGQDSSAQEKLLEEKHKEQFGEEAGDRQAVEDDLDEDFDDFDFDADDNLEESVPVVNAELYEDDSFDTGDVPIRNIEIQSSQQHSDVANVVPPQFYFTPPSMAFSPASTQHASEPTPRDDQGFAVGLAETKDSPEGFHAEGVQDHLANHHMPASFLEGLRISNDIGAPPHDEHVHQESTRTMFDDSEMYFDDGEFDTDIVENGGHFDESLLDDESGQIRDIPAENARRYEAALQRSGPGDRLVTVDPSVYSVSRDTSSSSNFVRLHGGNDAGASFDQEPEVGYARSSKTSVLTEDNLAAYHEALVEAANYAAANGKFNRQVSFSSDQLEESEPSKAIDGPKPFPMGDSQGSMNNTDSEIMDDFDAFGFNDDDMDDELMIAEANAEALENDDDGFYGQEFGFYARAHGKDNSDFVNGGYFAARGSNGVKRSHSGKANFQEPSLTPITERSEWSARNSVASLPLHGGLPGMAQSLPSPGINQLMESPSYEDEMSLSALIRLRRGTFGGSSTSINSLGERSIPGSSPLAHVSGHTFAAPTDSRPSKPSRGSSLSILESEEEEDKDADQPTLTQNTPRKKLAGASPSTPQAPMAHLAVTESPHPTRKIHHRRNSSGADSVSYIRDKDGQWVLERRRTGDDGAQEVVEREYLAGARI